jgi:hypothetical protein
MRKKNMEALRVHKVLTKDREILVEDLPYKKGDAVEVILLAQQETAKPDKPLAVGKLRESGLIGMWKDRDDITDAVSFARRLREQAQRRGRSNQSAAGQ